jgi:hypothetical protein
MFRNAIKCINVPSSHTLNLVYVTSRSYLQIRGHFRCGMHSFPQNLQAIATITTSLKLIMIDYAKLSSK